MEQDNKNKDLLLRYHYVEPEEGCYEVFFKVYSNMETLELSKENKDETPLHIEIAQEDSFINDGEGFSLTINQTKELIKVLQNAVNFLEN